MNLNQFTSWKLLYEDEELCFSSAVNTINQLDVFFITFFVPENISKATKHLMDAHLHNFVALIEEEGKLHLILKQQKGRSIQKFIKRSNLEYDDRVQIVYEYLKMLEKYDAFNNAIKIQLLDEEQLLISDEGLAFRELIDYTLSNTYSEFEVFKQLGLTIDLIISDAEGYHSQFVDNLILGHHNYSSIKVIKKDFKDIFIFEKPDALESISSEYNIILNDLEAGPPLPYTSVPHKDLNPLPSTTIDLGAHHEDLHRELFELLGKDSPIKEPDTLELEEEIKEEIEDAIEEVIEEITLQDTDILVENSQLDDDIKILETDEHLIVHPENKLILEPDPNLSKQDESLSFEDSDQSQNETVNSHIESTPLDSDKLHHTTSFKAQYEDEFSLPESLPKSSKQRNMDDEDLFDDDVFDLFDEAENEKASKKSLNSKWVIIPICILLLALIIFFTSKILFSNEPIVVRFDVEPLRDNHVAFMNKTTGIKNVQAYEWEIYYHGDLIQTFTDENLFPIFDTEGTYTIVLKVEDKKGNWSDPFSLDYFVETTEEITTNP